MSSVRRLNVQGTVDLCYHPPSQEGFSRTFDHGTSCIDGHTGPHARGQVDTHTGPLPTCRAPLFQLNFPKGLVCIVLAILIHPDLNNRPVFDSTWTGSLYIDVVSTLPQLWMIGKMGGKVGAVFLRFLHVHHAVAISAQPQPRGGHALLVLRVRGPEDHTHHAVETHHSPPVQRVRLEPVVEHRVGERVDRVVEHRRMVRLRGGAPLA